eukprot:969906-Karenia_brevis.AAC.1
MTTKVPKFCGNYNRASARRHVCTEEACLQVAAERRNVVMQARQAMASRHAELQAPAPEADIAVLDAEMGTEIESACYTGASSKRNMMAAKRLHGTMGILGSIFPRCQLFGGFQSIFRCESAPQ